MKELLIMLILFAIITIAIVDTGSSHVKQPKPHPHCHYTGDND